MAFFELDHSVNSRIFFSLGSVSYPNVYGNGDWIWEDLKFGPNKSSPAKMLKVSGNKAYLATSLHF